MRLAAHRKLQIETLEQRQLLAASPLANALGITLTPDGSALQSGKIAHPGDTVAYRITATVNGTMVVRESPTGSSLFPAAVSMFDGTQRQLASNVGNLTATVQVQVTKGSTYYVVAAASQSTIGAYQMQIAMDDVGDVPAKATNIALINSGAVSLIGSATQSGKINYGGDVDYYKLTAVVPGGVPGALGNMTIRLAAQGSALRSVLDVYDANNKLLAENSATTAGAAYSQVTFLATSGSVYYLKASGALSSVGAYQIKLSTARVDDPLPHSFAAADAAWQTSPFLVTADPTNSAVGPVKTMSGVVAYPGDADYIRFVAPVTGSITLQQIADATQSSALDSFLYIYDAKQNLVISSNDSGASSNPLDSRVQWKVQAGTTYYLKATGFGKSTGAYQLLFSTYCTTTDDFPQTPTFSDTNQPSAIEVEISKRYDQQVGAVDYVGDVDWFSFVAPGNGTVTAQETVMSGSLAAQLSSWRSDGAGNPTTLVSSSSIGPIAKFDVIEGETYYLKAAGTNTTAGAYTLQVTMAGTPHAADNKFHISLHIIGGTAEEADIVKSAAARWESVVTGDLPDVGWIDDLLLDFTIEPIDGVNGILGQTQITASRPMGTGNGAGLPYAASIVFDSADVDAMLADETLFTVTLHEMGHALGFGFSTWNKFGLVSGVMTTDPRFVGTNATREYDNLFTDPTQGIPLESIYEAGAGTALSHWREAIMRNELMTGYLYEGPNKQLDGVNVGWPLSRITIGALQDIGYQVDYSKADPYIAPPPMSLQVMPLARAAAKSRYGLAIQSSPAPTDYVPDNDSQQLRFEVENNHRVVAFLPDRSSDAEPVAKPSSDSLTSLVTTLPATTSQPLQDSSPPSHRVLLSALDANFATIDRWACA